MSTTRSFDLEFSGAMAVAARMDGHIIATDQPVKDGGGDTAPSPFDLFLASLATCAGVYALRFCQSRGLPTEGLGLRATCTFAETGFHMQAMDLALTLPQGFPDKYRDALKRAVDLCAVKKHILNPPEFTVSLA